MATFSRFLIANKTPKFALLIAVMLPPFLPAQNSPASKPEIVSFRQFASEVNGLLGKEIVAPLADIRSFDPPQDRVVGVPTTGEFSWGTFLRALASYSELSGERTLSGRNVPQTIGKAALIEARHGGKAFAQMYAAMALRSFGTDLKSNPVWQSLTPREQAESRSPA